MQNKIVIGCEICIVGIHFEVLHDQKFDTGITVTDIVNCPTPFFNILFLIQYVEDFPTSGQTETNATVIRHRIKGLDWDAIPQGPS